MLRAANLIYIHPEFRIRYFLFPDLWITGRNLEKESRYGNNEPAG